MRKLLRPNEYYGADIYLVRTCNSQQTVVPGKGIEEKFVVIIARYSFFPSNSQDVVYPRSKT